MAKIVINDLERDDELDREAMRTITGGYNPLGINQTVPHSFSLAKPTIGINSLPGQLPKLDKSDPFFQLRSLGGTSGTSDEDDHINPETFTGIPQR